MSSSLKNDVFILFFVFFAKKQCFPFKGKNLQKIIDNYPFPW